MLRGARQDGACKQISANRVASEKINFKQIKESAGEKNHEEYTLYARAYIIIIIIISHVISRATGRKLV